DAAAEQLLALHVCGRGLPRDDADAQAVADHRLDDLDVLGLHDDFGRDALSGKKALYSAARDRSRLEEHERLTIEIGWCDVLLFREGMRRVGDEQELLAQDRY